MIGSTVTIKNINKSFDDFKVLKDINLEIKKGEFFSLLGPSGCGKTTLLRIIAGLEDTDTGDILFDNTSVLNIPPNKRPVNTIFQNYALFPHLTVFENIAFSMRLKKFSEIEIKEKVEKLLNLVKLEEHAMKKPHQLSGGQKQRVAIARALANEPKVLLLDEPVSALDAKLRQELLIELDNLHDQVGITFIYVTHDQAEALSISDHVAVMNEGKVVQYGTPYEIYESPANKFVATFIGETNLMKSKVIEINEEFIKVTTPGIGEFICYKDKDVSSNDNILITLRPEKIKISKKSLNGKNVFHGIIEEEIYMGYQTRYFVKLDNGYILKVYKQHINYLLDETILTWKDEVFVSWDPNDSFIVEVE
ncbi:MULTISPECIES: ABC transporter ATP-binding protein [unclassified Thermosipho (in: thermotogales)]|uniref:ABC transporter ATP-binding protein n=1 Tax=unclassified Thermosipho (in: thermotogales) TaxID=2676525 RepID=UPI000986F3F4|nr:MULTISPECIES: ABC transporter ATP-binding protein [unclassified Thermosipho (in: thermotogales)]MBT1248171.1 spermidine/putrescine ABC transporter ATP-binding protein [Thermosipho sp. 1244]OOC46431.1 spermidine/putrescine ABC transporter ATP-binding protein [Thermosipho sp. 1223]